MLVASFCSRYSFHQVRHWAGFVATGMGRSKKAVAQFLGQTDTGATERYMHSAQPELWEVAHRLEREVDLQEIANGVQVETGGGG